jgi:hypothetical protein
MATSANGEGPDLSARLRPQHLADLRKSGLSDEQIAKCGFRTVVDPVQVATYLRWKKGAGILGPCLAIPFPDATGKLNG